MDINKLIKQIRNNADTYRNGKTFGRVFADQGDILDNAAIALTTFQAENKKLRLKLEQVKKKMDAAIDCIYKIEDDLDRGNDNDWAREHISEWKSQKED